MKSPISRRPPGTDISYGCYSFYETRLDNVLSETRRTVNVNVNSWHAHDVTRQQQHHQTFYAIVLIGYILQNNPRWTQDGLIFGVVSLTSFTGQFKNNSDYCPRTPPISFKIAWENTLWSLLTTCWDITDNWWRCHRRRSTVHGQPYGLRMDSQMQQRHMS